MQGLTIVVNSSDNDTGELIGILNTLAIFSGNSSNNYNYNNNVSIVNNNFIVCLIFNSYKL